MKRTLQLVLIALMTALLAGCAGMAFNRIDLTTNRHITIGQELMDLQAAYEKGVINDTEYTAAKQDLLKMVNGMAEFKDD